MDKTELKTQERKRELIIVRSFDVPRETLWKFWTEPEEVKKWWGPKGFTAPYVTIDLRVGGKYLSAMRSPEGKDFWSTGVFREIKRPERLVMTDSFADEKGNIVPASHYGMSGDWPAEFLITVTFEKSRGKTRMTLKHNEITGMSDTDFEYMHQGWNEQFDKLGELLKGTEK